MNDEQRKAIYQNIIQLFTMLPEEEMAENMLIQQFEKKYGRMKKMKHIFTDGIFHIYVEDVNKWIYHTDLRLENAIRWDGNNTDKIDDFLSDRVHSIDVREDTLDIYIWEGHICLTQGDYLVKAQDGKICIAERTVQPEGAKYLLRFPT